jgi:hypothetical protein
MMTESETSLVNHSRHSRGYLALALWLLIAGAYFSLAEQWISWSMNDRAFAEYTQRILSISARERRPVKEVRDLLLIRAGDLSLPVNDNHITVVSRGSDLTATVEYDVDLTLPLLRRRVYGMTFQHKIAVHPPG